MANVKMTHRFKMLACFFVSSDVLSSFAYVHQYVLLATINILIRFHYTADVTSEINYVYPVEKTVVLNTRPIKINNILSIEFIKF